MIVDSCQRWALGRAHKRPAGETIRPREVPGNGESWFVARCLRDLAARGVVGVESCADPVTRQDASGHRVFPGHAGTVYQALGGRYVGRTNAATRYLLPDGRELSNRAQGKIGRAEQGRAYAGAVLVDHGADPLASGEDPLLWLRRWRPRLCRTVRHRGCHRYIWALDRRRRRDVLERHPSLAYPKIDLERGDLPA